MQLGEWEFDAGTQLLTRGEESRRLDPVNIGVLLHLVENAPNLVTTEELLARNWPGVVVGDNVVHRVVAILRKTLGDNPRQPTYIETLPRRGYRFIGEVSDNQAIARPEVQGEAAEPSPEYTIAVLPFTNLGSADDEMEYLGDGVAEDILNGLVRSMSTRVIARTSSFQFKNQNVDVRDIGEKLGATHLLEGSVRKSGNKIRVTAQLLSAVDGAHLWSEQFDSEQEDMFKVQDEITRAVLMALNLFFIPRSSKPTTNPAAYAAFAEGMRNLEMLNLEAGLAALNRALVLDPDYADVHAEVAGSAVGLVLLRVWSISEMREAAGNHAERALAIDPRHHKARSHEAELLFFMDRSFQEAIDLCHELFCERPNNPFVVFPYPFMMRALGKHELGIEVAKKVVALDPLNPIAYRRLAEDLIWSGDVDAAEIQAKKCIEVGMPVAHYIATIALLRGDRSGAWAQVNDPDARWDSEDRRLWFAAELARDEGDQAALNGYIKELEPYAGGRRERLPGPGGPRPLRASIELLRGNIELALDSFEQSIDESFAAIWHASGFSSDFFTAGIAHVDRSRYPDYFSHPRYQKIHLDRGLDEASLRKIEVPPFPF